MSEPTKHPLHNAETRDLLTALAFGFQSESRKGSVYYRPLSDEHLSMVIVLGPEAGLDDVADAIFQAGLQSQAHHIASSVKSVLHSLRLRDEPEAEPWLNLLHQPIHARHALLSMGPLLTLERALWPQSQPRTAHGSPS